MLRFKFKDMQCWNTYIPCVFAYASLKSGVQKMFIWIKFCLLLPSLILIVIFSFFVKLHCMTLPPLHYYPFPLSYITFEQFNPIHCLRSWKWSKDKYNVYIITTVWNFSGIRSCVKSMCKIGHLSTSEIQMATCSIHKNLNFKNSL